MDKQKLCSELMVANKIHETDDTVSLVFDIPPQLERKFNYRAGQFVTLFLDVAGEELRRSYSLASSPDYDDDFKISVKLVPGGKGSTHLLRNVKVGDKLWVTPPAGFFVLPTGATSGSHTPGHAPSSDHAVTHFSFYAAGSGITPVISLIKSALKRSSQNRCVLFYQNRSEANVIFKNELAALAREFSGRFHVEHVISKAGSSWRGMSGRLTSTMIRQVLQEQKLSGGDTYHYVCGPDGFMSTVLATLQNDLHVNKDKIIKESFASGMSGHSAGAGTDAPNSKLSTNNTVNIASSTATVTVNSGSITAAAVNGGSTTAAAVNSGSTTAAAVNGGAAPTATGLGLVTASASANAANASAGASYTTPEGAIFIGDKAALGKPEKIEAIVDGETHFVDYKEGQSVLDCLLNADLSPPYSCLDGACMACIAKVKSGLVYQTDLGILSEDNVEVSECLTCQAKPASKNVKIHYESF